MIYHFLSPVLIYDYIGVQQKKWRIAYEHANCKTYLGQQEVQKSSFALFSLGLSSFFSRESVLASSMLQEIRLFSSMLSVFSVTFEDVVAGPLTLLICCIQCQVRLLPAWTCTRPPVRYNPKKCILYTKWMRWILRAFDVTPKECNLLLCIH